MREFWRIEDNSVVSKVIWGIIEVYKDKWGDEKKSLLEKCKKIAERLASINVNLGTLKNRATKFDEKHLKEQILRIEKSIETDPELAIGTAKELVETCCKTILDEADYKYQEKANIQKLTKETLAQLQLIPDGVNNKSRGSDIIKRILQNLGAHYDLVPETDHSILAQRVDNIITGQLSLLPIIEAKALLTSFSEKPLLSNISGNDIFLAAS